MSSPEAMRQRYPDFRFVEIVQVDFRGKDRAEMPVGRV